MTLNAKTAVAAIEAGATEGVQAAVEYLLTEANKHVPHDEGTLERSGSTSVDGTQGAVSYDTPYAVYQHEDMTLHHHGKGEAKWLENTCAREGSRVTRILAVAARKRID